MIAIELCLGAPVIEPDGKSASNSAGSSGADVRAFTVEVICHCIG